MAVNTRLLLAACLCLTFLGVTLAKVELVSKSRKPVLQVKNLMFGKADVQKHFKALSGGLDHHGGEESSMKKAFAFLFPFDSPAWNSSKSTLESDTANID
jgi:hypothetical protein